MTPSPRRVRRAAVAVLTWVAAGGIAGCATDDLVGWSERKDGENKRYPGILDGFELSRQDAEEIVMRARVKAGWISEADLAKSKDEAQSEGEVNEADEGASA